MLGIYVMVLVTILVIIYFGQKYFFEQFGNTPNKITGSELELLVFVSNSCPHCVDYVKNNHDIISKMANNSGNKFKVKKIISDGSTESTQLFNKYDVKYVPTGIIVSGDKIVKSLGSVVTPETVSSALNSI